jgi:hypothetical protein
LFLAHEPKAESWTRTILLPRSPWAEDHGPPVPSSEAGSQSGSMTRQVEQIGAGYQYAIRQERPSHIRRTTAAMSSGKMESSRNAEETALVPANGQGVRGGRCLPSQMSALLRSFDEQDTQKMADLLEPFACQEFG